LKEDPVVHLALRFRHLQKSKAIWCFYSPWRFLVMHRKVGGWFLSAGLVLIMHDNEIVLFVDHRNPKDRQQTKFI